jgi:hypothetical protein
MEQRLKNRHETSEGWLRAATNDLRPYYTDRGLTIPEKIRFSIAFTSNGKPKRETSADEGRWPAECWPGAATDDGFSEIFIRADFADPAQILGILAHELVHAALPEAKHGKEFRDAALGHGRGRPMRRGGPGPGGAFKQAGREPWPPAARAPEFRPRDAYRPGDCRPA